MGKWAAELSLETGCFVNDEVLFGVYIVDQVFSNFVLVKAKTHPTPYRAPLLVFHTKPFSQLAGFEHARARNAPRLGTQMATSSQMPSLPPTSHPFGFSSSLLSPSSGASVFFYLGYFVMWPFVARKCAGEVFAQMDRIEQMCFRANIGSTIHSYAVVLLMIRHSARTWLR